MSSTWQDALAGCEARSFNATTINGEHTLAEYVSLYRRGEIQPLRYEFNGVPIVACRRCDILRPEDGTPCQSCGAYQCCTPINLDAESYIVAAQASAAERTGVRKPTNPRRNRRSMHNVR